MATTKNVRDSSSSKAPENSNSLDQDNFKLHFALNVSNIGIWDYDADLNRVIFSEESKNIIGLNNDDTFGSNPNDWNDRVHPDDREQYYKDFQDHLKGLKPLYENIHRIQCKDGTYKWIQDIGKIFEWTNEGQPKRIIGTHNDVTKEKESELADEKSLKLITKQNKKLKNFAHIVTHNLKSHSANFENLLEFYKEANSISEKEELIIHLKTVSDSLTKTISNLNKIVSIQTNKDDKVERLNIYEYINNTLQLQEVEIEKNEAVIFNKVDHDINLEFNPAYLESIFQNLLSNAIKYKHPERNPQIEFNSKITEENIVITIEDNGIGIDLDKYGNDIFNLYRTFHNNENSEGVGLYLIKNQIESFGGEIEVNSKVNIGSTFTITLPKGIKNPV